MRQRCRFATTANFEDTPDFGAGGHEAEIGGAAIYLTIDATTETARDATRASDDSQQEA